MQTNKSTQSKQENHSAARNSPTTDWTDQGSTFLSRSFGDLSGDIGLLIGESQHANNIMILRN